MELQLLIRTVASRLSEAAVDSPRLSAELLAAHALGMDRQELLKELLLRPERDISGEAMASVNRLSERRAGGEPAAYILRMKEFYGRNFLVSPDVLVPRPETELLVDTALELCGKRATVGNTAGSPDDRSTAPPDAATEMTDTGREERPCVPHFADFGTGSGCIAVTLALELPGWQGVALDKSPAALHVARENTRRLGAANLEFLLADFAAPPLPDASLDLLVSNPPYISDEEYVRLDREVRAFEPKSALVPSPGFPGCTTGEAASGLEDIATVILQAERLLQNGGTLLVEIGCAQETAVRTLLSAPCWRRVEIRQDLAGLPRLLVAEKH